MIVAADSLRAMLNEGNAANGSFGEGEATADFRNRALGALGVGLSRECAMSACAFFFGRPGDQSEPSFFPNRIGTVGDVTASCRPTDGDSMFSGSKETDSQNAWVRRVLPSGGDASPARLSGGGLVIVTRGDS
jgi:hypothetical protein